MEETSKGIISYNSEGVGVQQAENGEQALGKHIKTWHIGLCLLCLLPMTKLILLTWAHITPPNAAHIKYCGMVYWKKIKGITWW